MKTLQFIAILLLALVAGVFWGTWFTLTRSIDSFSAAEFIHIGKVIIANVATPMRIIMPSAIAAVALSVWLYGNKRSPGFYFLILSFMLLLVTLLVTLLVLVPIDNDIKHWTVATIPENWQSIRDHWANYHAARTITSLSALMCFVLSVLTRKVTPST